MPGTLRRFARFGLVLADPGSLALLEVAAEPLTSDTGQVLVTYVAAPGSPSEEALRLLAALAVT